MNKLRWAAAVVGVILLAACGGDGEESSAPKNYTVGIIAPYPSLDDVTTGFQDALTGYGYITGETATYISTRARDGDISSVLAAQPDVIFCVTTPACDYVYHNEAAAKIPVVFLTEIDPVETGYVEQWIKPGGHYTGISVFASDSAIEGLRLKLLLDIDPAIKRVFVPYNSTEVSASIKLAVLQKVADELGIELVLETMNTAEDLRRVADNIPDDIDAIFTFSEKIYEAETAIVFPNVAIMHQVPYSGGTVEMGALMAYGPEWYAVGEQAARLADQILKGIPAGDLPVETPDFVLSINLKTAGYIDLDVPDTMLRQAKTIVR